MTCQIINTIAESMKRIPDTVKPSTRRTRQRQLVLEELRRRKDHPTAEEVHAEVRRHMPSISLGTVYRNLEFLADRGEIRRIVCSGKAMRFDGNVEEHHHLFCLGCGRLEDLECGFEIPPMPLEGEKSGFSILWARVVFEGFCGKCAHLAGHEKGESI